MKLQTVVPIPTSPIQFDYQSKICCIGSCFSDHIGSRLKRLKFDCLNNPAGVLFNPISIFNLLNQAIKSEPVLKEKLVYRDGLYFHYDWHSMHYNVDKDILLDELNTRSKKIAESLDSAKLCIITLGSAWVYEHAEGIVANCHKMSGDLFQKRLLSPDEIKTSFLDFYTRIKNRNTDIHFIFTISPVRHWKDGPENNQLSKSILHLFKHEVCSELKDCHYFPSYEIVMDELRDYRYYKQDMLHPNETAVRYICDKFMEAHLSNRDIKEVHALEKLLIGMEHKVLHPESKSHLKFLHSLEEKLVVHPQAKLLQSEIEEIRNKIQQLQ